MEKNLIVSKEKSFVQAIYRVSLDEQRLLHYAIAKVHPTQHKNRLLYDIEIAKLAKFYGIEDTKNQYKYFREAIERLFNRRVQYRDEINNRDVICRFISEFQDDRQGILALEFTTSFKNLISFNKEFLSYSLEKTVGMTSATSVRIYEILLLSLKQSQLKTINRPFKIDEFKKMLGLEDKYPRFSNFKTYVLEVAQKQINKHTDLNISYEVKKMGRTPTTIAFKVKYKVKRKIKVINQDEQPKANNNLIQKNQETVEKAKGSTPEKQLTTEQSKKRISTIRNTLKI